MQQENKATQIKNKTTGILYISDNDNMFIAPEGISKEEYKRISLETDRNALKEKLESIEKEISELPEENTGIEEDVPVKNEKKTESKEKHLLPDFTVQTKDGIRLYKGMHVAFEDKKNSTFYLDNGKEKLILPAVTFQSIIHPESMHPKTKAFKDAQIAEKVPGAVMGQSVLPEFSLITTGGIEVYKGLKVQSFNQAEDSYVLSDGNTTITVTAQTFREINSPERYEKTYGKDTPSYEKLIKSQYDEYFKQRDNTAGNFIHNLSVYCRKEANTPLDAVTISREIISRMNKDEKEKTRYILSQMAQEDRTINQVLIETYYDAVKGVPIDKNVIQQKRNEETVAKPFNDTIHAKGALVDENSKLRIGDTICDMAFNVPVAFGRGKERIFEDLTVISASRDGNNIILMDKDRSFYELPRDTVLRGYNRQQEKQQKAEIKQRKAHRIDVGWER